MKSPAFQFYAAEFLVDENVVLMSNIELGCYIKLMCFAWREGSIPNDVNKIAKLCGENGSAMADLWLAIAQCFTQLENDTARLVHPRLEIERKKQEAHKKERSESGTRGAKARWEAVSKDDSSANGSAIQQLIANDGSSSSTSSSTSLKNKNNKPQIPYQKIVDLYHEFLPGCPRTEKLTTKRKDQIRARWQDELNDLMIWAEYFQFCASSDFLTGKVPPSNGHKRFVADLEFLTNESNYAKIIERKYHA